MVDINRTRPAIHAETRAAVRAELEWFVERSRTPRLRTMRQFAIDEIVIPDGPFEGRRFRIERQPYTGLYFDAVDSGRYNEINAVGPSQSGKTLTCFAIPTLYHLFEIGESVICGLPDMDMAGDKWEIDLKPVIQRSRYRDLLPKSGRGSRGGKISSITFRNGATLKFMSGGGGDKSRSAFTSRVLVITEVDGLATTGKTSHEADKIKQLEARTRAFGNRRRIYKECTVTVEEGAIWQGYSTGTASKIMLPCPHCEEHVLPEREHLNGHQAATNENEARAKAAFFCPSCGEAWSEDDRQQANRSATLLHQGQVIGTDGAVEGPHPETQKLGFRWSAVHNLFVTAADLGADEYDAARAPDEDSAEREMCQFVWATPYTPPAIDVTPLTAEDIVRRSGPVTLGRGVVPADADFVTVSIDIGKRLGHWSAFAHWMDASAHVVDYDRFEIPTDSIGLERALWLALRGFAEERLAVGWSRPNGETVLPLQVWIDSGYQGDIVRAFCLEQGDTYRPILGRGISQDRSQWYNRPKSTGNIVKHIGDEYHIVYFKDDGSFVFELNADHYKSRLHDALAMPATERGALTVYTAPQNEHLSFAKHLTAEKQIEEFIPGRGLVMKWEKVRKSNHWLDTAYMNLASGHWCGARAENAGKPPAPQQPVEPARESLTMPDGRPFLITER